MANAISVYIKFLHHIITINVYVNAFQKPSLNISTHMPRCSERLLKFAFNLPLFLHTDIFCKSDVFVAYDFLYYGDLKALFIIHTQVFFVRGTNQIALTHAASRKPVALLYYSTVKSRSVSHLFSINNNSVKSKQLIFWFVNRCL